MQSIADLDVSSAVTRALSARGISEPFAVQRLVVPDVLAGREAARSVRVSSLPRPNRSVQCLSSPSPI
jgi:superfamily II DNA/RNA helicase